MRVLVFGASGMLGHKLVQILSAGCEVSGTLRGSISSMSAYPLFCGIDLLEGIDAAVPSDLQRAIDHVRPDVVINAVGIVKQLPTSKDVISTLTINSIFPHRLSAFAEQFGFRLITVSTDCVFDGSKGMYLESDTPTATDLYGRSKNLGEVTEGNALTLRTSIIGRELGSSHSLVEWFLSNEGRAVKGFTNAIYSGFPTLILAGIIRDLIFDHPGLSGLYHVSSEPINKFELLKLMRTHYGANIEIEPDDKLRIDRSLDSSLFRQKTGFKPLDWESMVAQMVSDPTPYRQWR